MLKLSHQIVTLSQNLESQAFSFLNNELPYLASFQDRIRVLQINIKIVTFKDDHVKAIQQMSIQLKNVQKVIYDVSYECFQVTKEIVPTSWSPTVTELELKISGENTLRNCQEWKIFPKAESVETFHLELLDFNNMQRVLLYFPNLKKFFLKRRKKAEEEMSFRDLFGNPDMEGGKYTSKALKTPIKTEKSKLRSRNYFLIRFAKLNSNSYNPKLLFLSLTMSCFTGEVLIDISSKFKTLTRLQLEFYPVGCFHKKQKQKVNASAHYYDNDLKTMVMGLPDLHVLIFSNYAFWAERPFVKDTFKVFGERARSNPNVNFVFRYGFMQLESENVVQAMFNQFQNVTNFYFE